MTFIEFAGQYGLVIEKLVEGRWMRCKTADRPRKWNGSYKYLGDVGFAQNHRTMDQVAVWRSDERSHPTSFKYLHHMRRQAAEADLRAHESARRRAEEMLSRAVVDKHPYLASKGFPEERGFVLEGELLIPMRAHARYSVVNSVQIITAEGAKRFLSGGKAKESVFIIGHPRPRERWLVEGFATALSVRAALGDLRRDAQVIVAFSAGNLAHIGRRLRGRSPKTYVMADNDQSGAGWRAAAETGLPWAMPAESGLDANDLHQRHGLRALVRLVREMK